MLYLIWGLVRGSQADAGQGFGDAGESDNLRHAFGVNQAAGSQISIFTSVPGFLLADDQISGCGRIASFTHALVPGCGWAG